MTHDGSIPPTTDPFSQFWGDMMSRMSPGASPQASAFQPSANLRDEAAKQMRRAFLDAWAQHCEEFMRSDAFLAAMKQSMDGALEFRRQMNEFLTKALGESQMPARSDTDAILQAVRSFEGKVLDQLAALQARVGKLEAGAQRPATVSRSGDTKDDEA